MTLSVIVSLSVSVSRVCRPTVGREVMEVLERSLCGKKEVGLVCVFLLLFIEL